MIRKAEKSDIDGILQIYEAIHDAEEAGLLSIGWSRNVYPVRQTAEDAVSRGDMFVLTDQGILTAAGIINQIQVPDYKKCAWTYSCPDHEVMVLHTLTVDPRMRSKGYGSRFVSFYEAYALEHGCPYLRMDTNAKNLAARALYKKLGYTEAGIVPCTFNGLPDVSLVCLEKKLT